MSLRPLKCRNCDRKDEEIRRLITRSAGRISPGAIIASDSEMRTALKKIAEVADPQRVFKFGEAVAYLERVIEIAKEALR